MKTPSSPVSLFTASQHEGADLQFFVHQAKVAPQKLKETHPLLIYQSTDRFITRCSAPEQPTHATFYALTWNKTHPNVMNEQFIALEPSGVSLGPLKYDLSKSIVLYKNTGLHLHLVFSCMEQNHKTRQPPLTPPRVFGRIKLNLKKKRNWKSLNSISYYRPHIYRASNQKALTLERKISWKLSGNARIIFLHPNKKIKYIFRTIKFLGFFLHRGTIFMTSKQLISPNSYGWKNIYTWFINVHVCICIFIKYVYSIYHGSICCI